MSSKPLLSPGGLDARSPPARRPDQHGIGHFVAVDDKTGEQLPVTSQMRRVKALWNILSETREDGRGRRLVGDLARPKR